MSITGASRGELGAWETSVGGVEDLDKLLLIEALETECKSWEMEALVAAGRGGWAVDEFAAFAVGGAGSQLAQK